MSAPLRFRKKPVVVEAWRYERPEQRKALIAAGVPLKMRQLGAGSLTFIPTLAGELRVTPGDWIIRGVAGEFYPCKPEIFAATYEPAE